MARRRSSEQRPSERPTRVLLVRHGHTESTGSVLPGRAPGLNLSDTGRTQAQRTAELIADGNDDRRRVHVAARAGAADGGADRSRDRAAAPRSTAA